MHSGLTAAMEFTTWRTASIPCASRPVVETTHHCPVMLGAIWFAPERFRPQGGRTRGGAPPTTAAVPQSSSFQAPKVALQQCSVDPNDSSPPLGRCAQNLAIGTGVREMTFFHSKSLDYARPAFLHQPFLETDGAGISTRPRQSEKVELLVGICSLRSPTSSTESIYLSSQAEAPVVLYHESEYALRVARGKPIRIDSKASRHRMVRANRSGPKCAGKEGA